MSHATISAPLPGWLVYCRPGFERDCLEETQAQLIEGETNSGFLVLQGKPKLDYRQLTFARQLIQLKSEIQALPERDRLTPLLAALPSEPACFGTIWLETPDTNDGKELSGFTRRFQPLLETALNESGRLQNNDQNLPRLHIFFPDKQRALIGISYSQSSANVPMGIVRMKMPHDAPSRSYLKLGEALEVLLNPREQTDWLKTGMTAVDLGAAPGGWTWQLVQHGLKVIAVDNGPMKGVAASHPNIKHLRKDGFRFRPDKPIDWVVCDMVEQPQRVAELMADWIINGHAQRAIFNLKLPMKKRTTALNESLAKIRSLLAARGIKHRLQAKQLYHDREEVTVLLARLGR